MGKSVGAAYNTIKSKDFCFIDNAAAILFEVIKILVSTENTLFGQHNETNQHWLQPGFVCANCIEGQ